MMVRVREARQVTHLSYCGDGDDELDAAERLDGVNEREESPDSGVLSKLCVEA